MHTLSKIGRFISACVWIILAACKLIADYDVSWTTIGIWFGVTAVFTFIGWMTAPPTATEQALNSFLNSQNR